MSTNAETPTLRNWREDAVDSGTLLGDPQWWWRLEVGDGLTRPAIVWTEEMPFHADRHPQSVEADGWPRIELVTALSELLAEYLGREVWVEEGGGDVPNLEVSVELPLTLDDTLETAANAAWPVVATLTNVFDPGTFNAPYVVGAACRRAGISTD